MTDQSFIAIRDFHLLRGLLYRCRKCPYFTKSLLSLKVHTKRHNSQPETFSCQRNDLSEIKMFISQWCNRNILRSNNPTKLTKITLKNYICKKCLFSTCSRYLSAKHPNVCQAKKRNSKSTIKQPVKLHDPDKMQNVCFSSKLAAENHTIRENVKFDWLQCTKCDFKTISKLLLEDHFNRFHATLFVRGRWLMCEVCTFKTKNKSKYDKHIKQHEREWFICSKCKFKSLGLTALKKHKMKNKCRATEVVPKKFDCSKSILETFICKKCKFRTHFMAFFRQHMLECQNTNKTDELKFKLTDYRCQDCPFKTFSYFVLFRHRKRNCPKNGLKMQKCQKCNFATTSVVNFEMHMKTKHMQRGQGATWYRCPYCQYKAEKQSDFTDHVHCNHTTTMKWLQCPQCEYKTLFLANLYLHIKYKHLSADKSPTVNSSTKK